MMETPRQMNNDTDAFELRTLSTRVGLMSLLLQRRKWRRSHVACLFIVIDKSQVTCHGSLQRNRAFWLCCFDSLTSRPEKETTLLKTGT